MSVVVVAAIGAHEQAILHGRATGAVQPVASVAPPTPTTTSVTPSAIPAPALTSAQQAALTARVRRAITSQAPAAKVGMEVFYRPTGTVVTSLNPGQQFAAMSVVKLFIAIDLLASDNWALPDLGTQQEITKMISTSDDDLASDFWSKDGRSAIINRDIKRMGLTETAPPADPGEWGDTRITAHDMVTVYAYVASAMPAPDHDLLYKAMYNTTKTAADGTDQYFGIPEGLPGTTWAIKQGWGSSGPNADYNTTGLLGTDSQYVVIVLIAAPLSDYGALPGAITRGTAQLASVLGAGH